MPVGMAKLCTMRTRNMHAVKVTVRTLAHNITYVVLALTTIGAFMDAASLLDDTPCGITVTPA